MTHSFVICWLTTWIMITKLQKLKRNSISFVTRISVSNVKGLLNIYRQEIEKEGNDTFGKVQSHKQ